MYWSHQPFINSNIPIPLKNLIFFSTSKSFPSSVLMSSWILCFFLLSLHWGQSCRQCFIVSPWFPHTAFTLVGCWLFINIIFEVWIENQLELVKQQRRWHLAVKIINIQTVSLHFRFEPILFKNVVVHNWTYSNSL